MFDAVEKSLVTEGCVGVKKPYGRLALRQARKVARAGAMLARSQTYDFVERHGNGGSEFRFRSRGGSWRDNGRWSKSL